MSVVVAEAGPQDLPALERDLPTGAAQVHRAHLRSAQEGVGTYLVAREEGRALGTVVVRWRGPVGARARRRYAGTPEIAHLQVDPPARGRGVGTALVAAAEELIAARGSRWSLLGVGLDNPRALELYLRLGYRRTDVIDTIHYTWVDAEGVAHPAVEDTLMLCRSLSPPG